MVEATHGASRPTHPTILVASARRELAFAGLVTISIAASVALLVASLGAVLSAPVDDPPAVAVVGMIFSIWAIVLFGLLVPVAVSRVRHARFRIVVAPGEIELRDGRTVAWSDVARIAPDPMSPYRICLWLVDRTTPPAFGKLPLEQPNPVGVSLRGLDGGIDHGRAVVEAAWRASRAG